MQKYLSPEYDTIKKRLVQVGIRQILLVLSVLLWGYAFITSIIVSSPFFADLRNRVVGARLMKDGLSPYFYIWHVNMPVRYYDTFVQQNTVFSKCTSSPALNWLFTFFCDLPQYHINIFWFAIQWMCIAAIVWCGCKLAATRMQKVSISLLAAFFSCSAGMRQHFFQGQIYLLVPACILLAIVCTPRKMNLISCLIFGVCLSLVVFVRPTYILLAIPFLFYKKYRSGLIAFGCLLSAYAIFAFQNKVQLKNWQDYTIVMKYFSTHYTFKTDTIVLEKDALPYTSVEGVQLDYQPPASMFDLGDGDSGEFSNYFPIHQRLFGTLPPFKLIVVFQIVGLIVGALLILLILRKRTGQAFLGIMIVCCCVVWGLDFLMPVHKSLYYNVFLLLPVILLLSLNTKLTRAVMGLTFLGLLLNTHSVKFLTMSYTVGQLLLLAACLLQVYANFFQTKYVTGKTKTYSTNKRSTTND
ncbi:MAG: glycosyltransferase family 87 protein [Chitinophagaceae bacterium]